MKFGWKVGCAMGCRFMQLVVVIVGSTEPLPLTTEIYG